MANEAWTTRGRAQWIGRPIVTKAVTAENQWTTGSYFSADHGQEGLTSYITLEISGTFTATVTLQRSSDDGSTWIDVATYTQATATDIQHSNSSTKWRAGVKTGNFTSGTVNIKLHQA